jgi:hypothetical protein
VEETMTKVLYKPVGVLVSMLGGVLAGTIFKQVWKVPLVKTMLPGLPTPTEAGERSCSPPPCRVRSSA